MAKQLKKWQGWLLFGGAMFIIFALGMLCSSMLERRAEVASVFNINPNGVVLIAIKRFTNYLLLLNCRSSV